MIDFLGIMWRIHQLPEIIMKAWKMSGMYENVYKTLPVF